MQCYLPNQKRHGFFFDKPWFTDTYKTVAIRFHTLPDDFSTLDDARRQECVDEIISIIDQAMAKLNPKEIYIISVAMCTVTVRLHAIRFPEDVPLFRQAAVMQLCYVEDFFIMHNERADERVE